MSTMNASLSTYDEPHRTQGAPRRLAALVVTLAVLSLATSACAAAPGNLPRGASHTPDAPDPWTATHAVSRGIPKSPLEHRRADLVLLPDPSLTVQRLSGAREWADAVGLDVATLRGYESIGTIQPWTGARFDGLESCLLLRTDAGPVLRFWSCAPAGSTPSVGVPSDHADGRTVGPPHGSVLTFIAVDGVIEVRESAR